MTCPHCNPNPSLNDGSLGIKWIQGNTVIAHACGCKIEGRGFTNYPLHIHYCDQHARGFAQVQVLDSPRFVIVSGGVAYPTHEQDTEVIDLDDMKADPPATWDQLSEAARAYVRAHHPEFAQDEPHEPPEPDPLDACDPIADQRADAADVELLKEKRQQ